MPLTEQPIVDLRDTRLAVGLLADTLEWLLVREKKRLGEQDCKLLLGKIDLVRALLSDEEPAEDG